VTKNYGLLIAFLSKTIKNDQNQSFMILEARADLAPERRERMRNLIRKAGVARVEDLKSDLKVSVATVRRDLEALEEEGRIRRVHGGAVSMESRLEEEVFDDKANLALKEKRLIAEEAFKLIGTGDSIYLDGGSTVLELARLLAGRTDLTVVTNSLRAAAELAESGPRVILTGGELRRLSQTMVGPLTRVILGQVRLDKAFMGTMGLSIDDGLTTTDPNEAFTKSLVQKHARQVILLADARKAGKVSFARVSDLESVDILISDKNFPAKTAGALRKRGLKVRLA
jgi:DeoR family fructose operon transcriptional repressor